MSAAAAVAIGVLLIISVLLGVSILGAKQFINSHLYRCGNNVTSTIDKICTEKIVSSNQFYVIKRRCIDENIPKFPKTLQEMLKPCVDGMENNIKPCEEKNRKEFRECIRKRATKYLKTAWKEYKQNGTQTNDVCNVVDNCFVSEEAKLKDVIAPIKTAANAG